MAVLIFVVLYVPCSSVSSIHENRPFIDDALHNPVRSILQKIQVTGLNFDQNQTLGT